MLHRARVVLSVASIIAIAGFAEPALAQNLDTTYRCPGASAYVNVNARVRSGPGTNYSQVGRTLASGTYVTDGTDSGGWTHIVSPYDGYIRSDLISCSGGSGASGSRSGGASGAGTRSTGGRQSSGSTSSGNTPSSKAPRGDGRPTVFVPAQTCGGTACWADTDHWEYVGCEVPWDINQGDLATYRSLVVEKCWVH